MKTIGQEHAAKLRAARSKPRLRACRECGAEFTATQPNARYCGEHRGQGGSTRRWKNADPERVRQLSRPGNRRRLLRRYGLTPDEYNAMLEAQGGVCAICLRPETRKSGLLHVDHDHETGRVRGLLCWECNTSIGKLDHDPERLRRAIAYLEVTPGL